MAIWLTARSLLSEPRRSVTRAAVRPMTLLGPSWLSRLAEPGEGVPYGLAIAIGGLAAFPQTPFLAALPH